MPLGNGMLGDGQVRYLQLSLLQGKFLIKCVGLIGFCFFFFRSHIGSLHRTSNVVLQNARKSNALRLLSVLSVLGMQDAGEG